jgi:molybdopterin-biosynthesis enzyme MoeA-like protein
VDTNSAYFAKFCFSLGINLKRIEVIADDEAEIVETARRMSENYDFVVTSGGIGPTSVAPYLETHKGRNSKPVRTDATT